MAFPRVHCKVDGLNIWIKPSRIRLQKDTLYAGLL